MPTFSAFILTNWPKPHEGFEIPEMSNLEEIQAHVRTALNDLYPNEWSYNGQYIHKRSVAGLPVLAYISEHRTDIEALEYQIASMERQLAELPNRIAAAQMELEALKAQTNERRR